MPKWPSKAGRRSNKIDNGRPLNVRFPRRTASRLCLLASTPASLEYVSNMGQTAETGEANSPAPNQNRATISFVVTAREGLDDAAANLAAFRPKLHEDDEVIIITGRAPAKTSIPAADSRYSVVTLPDASAFMLRAHVPAVC